jgi:hypothetical protein
MLMQVTNEKLANEDVAVATVSGSKLAQCNCSFENWVLKVECTNPVTTIDGDHASSTCLGDDIFSAFYPRVATSTCRVNINKR